VEEIRSKVKDFNANKILLKLGERHTGAHKAREIAEAERLWKLENKLKDSVEKTKAIQTSKKELLDSIKSLAHSLRIKEKNYQVSNLFV
jgi:hypothetical protein